MSANGTRSSSTLWICDRALEEGGVACALYDLYPALSRGGCEIVFAAPDNATFPKLEALGAVVHTVLAPYPQKRGYLWSLLSCLAILRLVIRLKPENVVADHTNGLWLILFLKVIRYSVRAIYRCHGVEFLADRPGLARLVLRGLDHIVTVSEPEADTLKQLTHRPVALIPNCLPAHCLLGGRVEETRNRQDGPRVAYVGRLNKAKGIYAFIDIVAEIRKQLPSTLAVAAGQVFLTRDSKDNRSDLLALMQSVDIRYMGELQREEIFRELDVLLICSRRESFGLTVLEAPFFDVVPIAYDSPGTRFLLDGVSECLVENGNSEMMTAALIQLWRGPRQRADICKRLRDQFLLRFDPNVVATKLTAVFVNDG